MFKERRTPQKSTPPHYKALNKEWLNEAYKTDPQGYYHTIYSYLIRLKEYLCTSIKHVDELHQLKILSEFNNTFTDLGNLKREDFDHGLIKIMNIFIQNTLNSNNSRKNSINILVHP